jgi:hypothetical protein
VSSVPAALSGLAHEVTRGFARSGSGQTPNRQGGHMYIGIGTIVLILLVLLVIYLVRRA